MKPQRRTKNHRTQMKNLISGKAWSTWENCRNESHNDYITTDQQEQANGSMSLEDIVTSMQEVDGHDEAPEQTSKSEPLVVTNQEAHQALNVLPSVQ